MGAGDTGGGSQGSDTRQGESPQQQDGQRGTDDAPGSSPEADDSASSGLGTRIAVVVIAVLLLGAVAGANVSVAADRTILDADHVTETMEEEGTFSSMAGEFRTEIADQVTAATQGLSLPPGIELGSLDGDAVARESVTDAYVRGEMSANIERLYAFLEGDRDEFAFVLDLRPVKESISGSIVDSITVDTPTLVGSASEDVDAERIAALGESQESYREAQLDLSDQEVSGLKDDAETQAQQAGYAEPVAEALIDLQHTVIDGVAGELTYDEYTEQLASDERALKEAIAASSLADIDDRTTLSGEGEDPAESFRNVRPVVQWLTTLAWLLPLVSVALIAALAAVSRSFETTARKTGWAFAIAGVLGLVVGFGLRDPLVGFYEDLATAGGESNAFVDGFVAAVDGMFGTLATQSILVTVVGIVLLALALADSRGRLDGVRQQLGGTDAAVESTEAAGDDEAAGGPAEPRDANASGDGGAGTGETDGTDADRTDRQ